jgi:hypothetical protein
LEDARSTLARENVRNAESRQQSSDTEQLNILNAATLQLDINKKNELVEMLNTLSKNNGIIYSTLSGVISSSLSKGNLTDATPLITFFDGAEGFEAHMIIEKSDAEKISIGDECQVTTGSGSMFYNPVVTGVITGISAPDEDDDVKIIIRLPEGNWNQGQTARVQTIMNRQSYPVCVPLSALRSDNLGYFVFVVEQSVTVFGVTNIILRLPVILEASDNELAAISGTVGFNCKIIIGSNRPIQSGDRVRIDNG